MLPDDPRHGTNRGYMAGCHEACCRAAHSAQHKDQRNRKYIARVDKLRIDGRGTRRRIQALMALGWSTREIDRLLGRQPTYTYKILASSGGVFLSTAQLIADLYDRISMILPDTSTDERRQIVARGINAARRRGYAPPLAWDDIDQDEAPRSEAYKPRYGYDYRSGHEYDEVVVLRILSGDFQTPATPAERREVVARWTGTLGELERATGWKPERYTTREDAA